MADWSKMRKTWTDNRDSHGVKKGAVMGVNVGDAIDKVAKADAKGYTSLLVAAKALDAALTKYKAKIAKPHPDFDKWIDKNIGAEVDKLCLAVAQDLAHVKWVDASIAHDILYHTDSLHPNTSFVEEVHKLMDGTPPKTWSQAVSQVGLFVKTESAAPEISKRATKLKTLKWSHTLSGHGDAYQVLARHADIVLEDVKFYLHWSKAADLSEFLKFVQESGRRNNTVHMTPKLDAAIKSLLG